MSQEPKFPDPKRPRGIFGTPMFKYYLGGCLITCGSIFVYSRVVSLLVQDKVHKILSGPDYPIPGSNVMDLLLTNEISQLKYENEKDRKAMQK